MNFRKGFKEVGDKLKTDNSIQILSMVGTGVILFAPLLWVVGVVDAHYNTADAFMAFTVGLGVIGLALWGIYEVTEAGKDE